MISATRLPRTRLQVFTFGDTIVIVYRNGPVQPHPPTLAQLNDIERTIEDIYQELDTQMKLMSQTQQQVNEVRAKVKALTGSPNWRTIYAAWSRTDLVLNSPLQSGHDVGHYQPAAGGEPFDGLE